MTTNSAGEVTVEQLGSNIANNETLAYWRPIEQSAAFQALVELSADQQRLAAMALQAWLSDPSNAMLNPHGASRVQAALVQLLYRGIDLSREQVSAFLRWATK